MTRLTVSLASLLAAFASASSARAALSRLLNSQSRYMTRPATLARSAMLSAASNHGGFGFSGWMTWISPTKVIAATQLATIVVRNCSRSRWGRTIATARIGATSAAAAALGTTSA